MKLFFYSLAFSICFVSCNQDTAPNEKTKPEIDTSVNEQGRLLPKKLRGIPFGINAGHFPNPCYAEKIDGMFVWKHNTTVNSSLDLQIVEYGSFVYTSNGWYHRVTYSAKDFDEHYGTKDGKLLSGVNYTDSSSWRRSDSLFAGDAMWYYVAKDYKGNLYKGIAPVETEGKILEVKTSNGIKWTGYGEIGDYSLSGILGIKTIDFKLNNDTLKFFNCMFDMNSMESENKDLVSHLSGADFFDTKTYPNATFKITEPFFIKDKKTKGSLTIKNKTNTVEVFVNSTKMNNQLILKGNVSFDRTKFGIVYNSKNYFSNLGDKAIKNNIDISFEIILN